MPMSARWRYTVYKFGDKSLIELYLYLSSRLVSLTVTWVLFARAPANLALVYIVSYLELLGAGRKLRVRFKERQKDENMSSFLFVSLIYPRTVIHGMAGCC